MRTQHWLTLLIFWLAVASMAHAQVDAQVVRTLQLKASPVDLVIPDRGHYIYVLTSDAKLQIYKNNGELRDILAVDPGVDRIQAGPGENRLYLINSADHKIQELNLDFIQKIPVDGSPTMGSLDAAVAVVVFTDFQ